MALSKDEITQDMFEPAEIESGKEEEIATESLNFWQDAFRRLRRQKAPMAGLVVILAIVAMAFIGPYFSPADSIDEQNLLRSNLPPKISWLQDVGWLPFTGENAQGVDMYESKSVDENYWFGADELGRDLWIRVWEGTKLSLLIGLVAGVGDIIIGVIYGGISGYFGGRVDEFMERIIEILIGIPQLVLMILLIVVMEPGIVPIMFAIMFTGWITQARIVRGQTLQLKTQEFTLAARALGANHGRIIRKHIIPNTIGMIIITMMFSIPNAIFAEAFLSFIGLGVPAPEASLGSLINEGFKQIQFHPYQALFPGILISLLLLAFNIFGDGLRDALDPKMRK
ncbi:ABC transporter permease [Virgibacillus siamensis]|uniref:ABC transporter permease n=1 Tax=Virgibacillus siamensis TaxID=480071 RepID=A0ABN1G8H4_9BACI